MKRIGASWGETSSLQDGGSGTWVEGWYTDICLTSWFPYNEWRCCMAKYDGVPYFLFIFGCLMFRLGKYGYWR